MEGVNISDHPHHCLGGAMGLPLESGPGSIALERRCDTGTKSRNNKSAANGDILNKGGGSKKGRTSAAKEQGSAGYVSERVRALSISNCPAPSPHRFGISSHRASYNEKIHSGPSSLQPLTLRNKERSVQEVGGGFVYVKGHTGGGPGLYRSNSSLDLDLTTENHNDVLQSPLRREYGSHGSINVASSNQESIITFLQDYKKQNSAAINTDEGCIAESAPNYQAEQVSPRVRSKLHRLWDKDRPSLFRKLRSGKSSESKVEKSEVNSDAGSNSSKSGSQTLVDSDQTDDAVKLPRRSAFSHYDCRSLAAQLTMSHLRTLLAERANTTTGASAAAMANLNGPQSDSTENLAPDESDPGDGRSNHLISSCPFFRNEIGGEAERVVSLSRDWGNSKCPSSYTSQMLHRIVGATTVGLLEPPVTTVHRMQMLCPYVQNPCVIEAVDQGANYYGLFFKGQEHQNWFGVDDALGPVAVSIKKERIEGTSENSHSLPSFQYRLIIRTSELFTCQGTLLEDCLAKPGSGDKSRGIGTREVLEYVCPRLSLSCLRLGLSSSQTEEALLRLDDMGVHKQFKVGVLYCKASQTSEEEMYNNEVAGPAFSEFLELLGQRVRLKDFDKYRGGLDKKTDSTGQYSVFAQYQDCEVMFHVSTLLPYTSNNRKQLLRKRHIGNDIVTIIFQEPGCVPFSPKCIRSHFQHVFIVVQAINPCSPSTQYSVAVSRFRDVPLFGPPMLEGATFPKSKAFTEFLLCKVINGEIAALRSEKFACMATRTRNQYLKDLSVNHSSATGLDSSSKFSLMGFSRSGKKDKSKIKVVTEACVRGGLSWPMVVHDASLQKSIDCVLAISVESVVVMEEESSSIIFATPCRGVIGWTAKPQQGLRLYYHQGECVIFNFQSGISEAENEEILSEIVSRLSAVTQGAQTQELQLKRNSAGLLGFNVQQDGVITEVEPYGLAAKAGLRQGARLVEICTVALATLSQEQMVDLLKTSMTVMVTVVPPHSDMSATARRGCNVPTCSFLLGGSEGDYENLSTPKEVSRKHPKSKHKGKHSSGPHSYDRSLSPPHSSNSSGYGTGNSSHSFSLEPSSHDQDPSRTPQVDSAVVHEEVAYQGTADCSPDFMGTLSSTSSGHSSDRWSESNEENTTVIHQSLHRDKTPPPLPARPSQKSSKKRGRDYQPGPATPYPKGSRPGGPMYYQTPSPPSVSPFCVKPLYAQPQSPLFGQPRPGHPGMHEKSNYAVPPSHPRPYFVQEDAQHCKVPDYVSWKNSKKVLPSANIPNPHHFESDRVFSARSEDELSGGSNSPCVSSKNKSGGASTPSSTSSRNQSPKTAGDPHGAPPLRQGPTPRKSSNRNSNGLASSNFQEDLFRLINPDYISDSELMSTKETKHDLERSRSCSVTNVIGSTNFMGVCDSSNNNNDITYGHTGDYSEDNNNIINSDRTRDPLSRNPISSGVQSTMLVSCSDVNGNKRTPAIRAVSNEGVVLTARPATVISNSSSTSSPAPNVDNRKSPEGSRSYGVPSIGENLYTHTDPVYSVHNHQPLEIPWAVSSPSSQKNPSHTNDYLSLPFSDQNRVGVPAVAPIGDKQKNENFEKKPSEWEGRPLPWVKADSAETTSASLKPVPKTFPSDVDQEWTNLVQTATQAMQKNQEVLPAPRDYTPNAPKTGLASPEGIPKNEALLPPPPPASSYNDRLLQLEHLLSAEQQRSQQLAREVSTLRSENQRLQEDSRAAAQQLHQFTEWFFNTIGSQHSHE